jgi:hypothetical protein
MIILGLLTFRKNDTIEEELDERRKRRGKKTWCMWTQFYVCKPMQ